MKIGPIDRESGVYMSGSTPEILGATVATGGAVVAVNQLADTGTETVLLSIAVGVVIVLLAWGVISSRRHEK